MVNCTLHFELVLNVPAGVFQSLASSRFVLSFFTNCFETIVALAPESHSILTVFNFGVPKLVFKRPKVNGRKSGVLSLFADQRLYLVPSE